MVILAVVDHPVGDHQLERMVHPIPAVAMVVVDKVVVSEKVRFQVVLLAVVLVGQGVAPRQCCHRTLAAVPIVVLDCVSTMEQNLAHEEMALRCT